MRPNLKRVLIVDDSPEDIYLLQEILRQSGIENIEAMTSGGEAAKYVAGLLPHQLRQMPDLIFADINMQGIDGLQLIRWLRRDPVFRNIPMVVLSGSADPAHKTDALKLGATAFYQKPQRHEELQLIVEAVLHTIFHTA